MQKSGKIWEERERSLLLTEVRLVQSQEHGVGGGFEGGERLFEVQDTQQSLADETVNVIRARCPVACATDLGRCDLSLGCLEFGSYLGSGLWVLGSGLWAWL